MASMASAISAADRDALIDRLETSETSSDRTDGVALPPPESVVDSAVRWERSPRMQERRADVIRRYKMIHGPAALETSLYYGTVEAKLITERERSGDYAVARFGAKLSDIKAPVLDAAFRLGIGDTSTGRLGAPRVITEADTNLSNPGQTNFADELFFVEALSARLRGVRICYSPEDIARMKDPASDARSLTYRIVSGQAFLLDETDGVLVFQGDIAHEVNRIGSQIPKIAAATSVHFTWRDRGIGGSDTTIDALIAPLADIPGVQEEAGKDTFALPRGYVWCLDKQFQANRWTGGNGLFDVEIQAEADIGLLFKPAAAFGLVPGMLGTEWNGCPTGFTVAWEIRLHGTSLFPAGSDGQPLKMEGTYYPRRSL